uniref:Uncharacterized protein n=1 Tax=Molossus molossus TaxID=27622 RepID=A0A7J8HCX2_MOLMO|nr:hypothetical protein HJG59_011220 [Molossus molossus]
MSTAAVSGNTLGTGTESRAHGSSLSPCVVWARALPAREMAPARPCASDFRVLGGVAPPSPWTPALPSSPSPAGCLRTRRFIVHHLLGQSLGNAKADCRPAPLSCQGGCISDHPRAGRCGERGAPCMAGGHAGRRSHCGGQCGGASKSEKQSPHGTQTPHFWESTRRK